MQAKLVTAREGLQRMTAHWRKEWQEVIGKWSAQVSIQSYEVSTCVRLPVDFGNDYLLIECDRVTLKPIYPSSTHSMKMALQYWTYTRDKCLHTVPVNLCIDIFHHFVTAFGGKFATQKFTEHDDYYYQHLYIDDENKRHHDIIHSALLSQNKPEETSVSSTDSTNITSSANYDHCDRWEKVWLRGIRLDGKLPPIAYINDILRLRNQRQTEQMVEYHFRSRGEKIIQLAKRFLESKLHRDYTGIIYTISGGKYLFLVNEGVDCGRELAKAFNLEDEYCKQSNWAAVMKNDLFAKLVGELTAADVQFLLCLFIDADYDQKESFNTINAMDAVNNSIDSINSASRFPTHSDNFSSFDFPHLTGVLAETILSKKLANYALGIAEINEGQFAAIAPAALTNIVMEYYPVDILNT